MYICKCIWQNTVMYIWDVFYVKKKSVKYLNRFIIKDRQTYRHNDEYRQTFKCLWRCSGRLTGWLTGYRRRQEYEWNHSKISQSRTIVTSFFSFFLSKLKFTIRSLLLMLLILINVLFGSYNLLLLLMLFFMIRMSTNVFQWF